jgi:hypothetical protein
MIKVLVFVRFHHVSVSAVSVASIEDFEAAHFYSKLQITLAAWLKNQAFQTENYLPIL